VAGVAFDSVTKRFDAVEAVRGRPLSERAQEMGFRIGLGLVLMLMVFATYNDILHLAAS